MPDVNITNPLGAFGLPATMGMGTGYRFIPMVNNSTSTVLAGSAVISSSSMGATNGSTQLPQFTTMAAVGVAINTNFGLGILHADTPAGAIGDVVVSGFHLVLGSTNPVINFGDLLVPATSLVQGAGAGTPVSGIVKTSTLITSSTLITVGNFIGQAQSSVVDATVVSASTIGQPIMAYIQKM